MLFSVYFQSVNIQETCSRVASSSLLLCFCQVVSSSMMMVSDLTVFQMLSALTVLWDYDLTHTLHNTGTAYFLSLTCHTEKELLLYFQGRGVQNKHLGSLSPSFHSLTPPSERRSDLSDGWSKEHQEATGPCLPRRRSQHQKLHEPSLSLYCSLGLSAIVLGTFCPSASCPMAPLFHQEVQRALPSLLRTDKQVLTRVWGKRPGHLSVTQHSLCKAYPVL